MRGPTIWTGTRLDADGKAGSSICRSGRRSENSIGEIVFGQGLSPKFGERFLFVSMIPTIYFAAVIVFLLAAGAPEHRPSWAHAWQTAEGISLKQLSVLSAALVIGSLALHPLQVPLVQLLEGYWLSVPGGHLLEAAARSRYVRLRDELGEDANNSHLPANIQSDAQRRLSWLPKRSIQPRSTLLGNTLHVGEERAGSRYGLATAIIWPRLRPLLPDRTREQVNDTRNQLDASVRYCVLSLVASVISVPLLIQYDIWMSISLGLFLFAWASYSAAVAAARRFSDELAVAFDLCHLRLWETLALSRPHDLAEERKRGRVLSDMLVGGRHIGDFADGFVYQEAKASNASG